MAADFMTNDFRIQELARVIDATLGNVNPGGLATGQNAHAVLRFLRDFPNMERFVSGEFYQLMRAELDVARAEDATINVRAAVKRCMTYPRKGYAPWNIVACTEEQCTTMRRAAEGAVFRIEIVDGKVYAVCKSQPTLTRRLYDAAIDTRDSRMECNDEACHITLVNSDVVACAGEGAIRELIAANAPDAFAIALPTGQIKTTFSEDWSRFSECAVVDVHSQVIDGFLAAFNERFGTSLRPAMHVTFAVTPRDLFRSMAAPGVGITRA